jgi:hypothetical protein
MTVGTAVSGMGSLRICARPQFAKATALKIRMIGEMFFMVLKNE